MARRCSGRSTAVQGRHAPTRLRDVAAVAVVTSSVAQFPSREPVVSTVATQPCWPPCAEQVVDVNSSGIRILSSPKLLPEAPLSPPRRRCSSRRGRPSLAVPRRAALSLDLGRRRLRPPEDPVSSLPEPGPRSDALVLTLDLRHHSARTLVSP